MALPAPRALLAPRVLLAPLARATISVLASIAPALFSAPAFAFGSLLLLDPRPQASTLLLGPSVATFPRFPGASTTRTWIFPGIDYYAPNGLFVSTQYGIGWNASASNALQAGVRLWPQFGRENSPPGLQRLRGVNDRIGAGPFVNYAPFEWLLVQSSVLYGSARQHDGMTAEVGVTGGVPLGTAALALSLGVTWANRPYRQDYFGISRADSAETGLAATRLGAGWNDLSAALSADVPLTRQWRFSGQMMWARLLGESAASPITQSRNQASVAATLWYRLH